MENENKIEKIEEKKIIKKAKKNKIYIYKTNQNIVIDGKTYKSKKGEVILPCKFEAKNIKLIKTI